MYGLIILPVVDKAFKKLAKKDKTRLMAIGKKIEQLRQEPYLGKPLHFPLQNLRRVHVYGSFVLIYDIHGKDKTVTIRDYGHHDDIYKR